MTMRQPCPGNLSLYACLAVASALTLASCPLWRPRTYVRWLTWGLVLSLLARCSLALQFTVVATWLGWAVVAWVVSVAHRRTGGTAPWRVVVAGVAGIGLAGLIRPEAAILGVLMSAPLLLWFWLRAAGVERSFRSCPRPSGYSW